MLTQKLTDPLFFAEGDSHALWRELRAADAVAWTTEPDGPGFWSVTRYADGVRVLKDWRTFSSACGTTLEGNRWQNDPAGGKILGLRDPPNHAELRLAVRPFFSARRLKSLEVDTRSHLRDLLERCTEMREFDFAEEVASRLPVHVAFRMLEIPAADWDFLFRLILQSLSTDETRRFFADSELLVYLTALAESRRRRPGDDLLSAIATTCVAGSRLADMDVALNFAHVISAGFTTTRLALTGALQALMENEGERQSLCLKQARLPTAVDEIIRWVSPVLVLLRTVTTETELGGRSLKPGQRVALWLPSVNRDSRVFAEPDRLRLDRKPNPHVGFGIGIHTCIGQVLAKLELRVFLDELTRFWRDIRSTAPPTRMHSLVLQGIEKLPIRIAPL